MRRHSFISPIPLQTHARSLRIPTSHRRAAIIKLGSLFRFCRYQLWKAENTKATAKKQATKINVLVAILQHPVSSLFPTARLKLFAICVIAIICKADNNAIHSRKLTLSTPYKSDVTASDWSAISLVCLTCGFPSSCCHHDNIKLLNDARRLEHGEISEIMGQSHVMYVQ